MRHTYRNWHIWMSLALGIPLILVGLTAPFIAHEKALGTKEIMLPAAWFGMAGHDAEPEVRASLQDQQGGLWLGTKQGLYRMQGGEATRVVGGPDDEIRALSQQGHAMLIAGKQGIWRMANGHTTRVHDGDCWQLSPHGTDGLAAACKDTGLLTSADGGTTWQATPLRFAQEPAMAAQGMPLSKFIMDIHTGKLFLGKTGEWAWIDALGISMAGLGLTGLVMWMRGRRQKAALASTAAA